MINKNNLDSLILNFFYEIDLLVNRCLNLQRTILVKWNLFKNLLTVLTVINYINMLIDLNLLQYNFSCFIRLRKKNERKSVESFRRIFECIERNFSICWLTCFKINKSYILSVFMYMVMNWRLIRRSFWSLLNQEGTTLVN